MTRDDSFAIYIYETLLLRKAENDRAVNVTQQFDMFSPGEKCKAVGAIWRYAITELLGWTPQQALTYLTEDIVKLLSLDVFYAQIGININSAKYIGSDHSFILQYAFPEQISYSFYNETLNDYLRVVKNGERGDGKLRNAKNFFVGEDGIKRAHILMQYCVNNYLSNMTLREKYEFFANTEKALKWIESKRLNVVLAKIYSTPLEYFHESLKDEDKSDFLYHSNYIYSEAKLYLTGKKRRKKEKSPSDV